MSAYPIGQTVRFVHIADTSTNHICCIPNQCCHALPRDCANVCAIFSSGRRWPRYRQRSEKYSGICFTGVHPSVARGPSPAFLPSPRVCVRVQGHGLVVTRSPETWCLCFDCDTQKLYMRDSHRKTQCVGRGCGLRALYNFIVKLEINCIEVFLQCLRYNFETLDIFFKWILKKQVDICSKCGCRGGDANAETNIHPSSYQ